MDTRSPGGFGGVRAEPIDHGIAPAARRYAGIVVSRESAGRPVATADAQIAVICASRGATLATRNTDDFDATGNNLFNPWSG
ncbi:PIN domain-containing protein [Bounagaea algeriensis]